jgi:tetratricopeptide (TPR) repeat protein
MNVIRKDPDGLARPPNYSMGLIGLFFCVATILFSPIVCGAKETSSVYDDAAKMTDAGDYKGAEAALKAQLAKDNKDYVAQAQLGSVYQEEGDRKKALKHLKDAVKLRPEYPPAHLGLGRLYFLMQKEDSAIEEFVTFMELMRREPLIDGAQIQIYINGLHYISDVCNNLRRYDTMKAAIDDILKLDPKDQAARYNLGVYYYNGKHSRSQAYQNFKAAIDLNPNSLTAKKAKYAIEFMRKNPDSRVSPDLSFIDQEYRD